jgi:hypothetical protein
MMSGGALASGSPAAPDDVPRHGQSDEPGHSRDPRGAG